MARRKFTAEVAREVATLAYSGEVGKIKVDQYKSGKKKGQYYIDYTYSEEDVEALFIGKMLNDAAILIIEGKEFDLRITKEPNEKGFAALKVGVKSE